MLVWLLCSVRFLRIAITSQTRNTGPSSQLVLESKVGLGAAQRAETLPRCWRHVLEGRTGGRCWDCAEEHEKASRAWVPLRHHQIGLHAGCRGQGRGHRPGIPRRRQAWGAGSPGAAGRRVCVAGFPFWVSGKGSKAWHPPCASTLTVPSPSPSPATLTSNVAPCGLSSSVRCERRVVGTGPVAAAPWGLLPLNPIFLLLFPHVLGTWELSVLASVVPPGVRPL